MRETLVTFHIVTLLNKSSKKQRNRIYRWSRNSRGREEWEDRASKMIKKSSKEAQWFFSHACTQFFAIVGNMYFYIYNMYVYYLSIKAFREFFSILSSRNCKRK